jgi:putative SOS response-associated peptidase YedK
MTGMPDEVGELLVSCPFDELEAYPISRRVNNPRNDDADLLKVAA